MRQAITTKYVGPTDTRGSRVIASCDAKRIIVSWSHLMNVDDNHIAAARKLASELGWSGAWHGGSTKGSGFCFVWQDTKQGDFIVGDRE